jgi:hypothetical protein
MLEENKPPPMELLLLLLLDAKQETPMMRLSSKPTRTQAWIEMSDDN